MQIGHTKRQTSTAEHQPQPCMRSQAQQRVCLLKRVFSLQYLQDAGHQIAALQGSMLRHHNTPSEHLNAWSSHFVETELEDSPKLLPNSQRASSLS